MRPKEGSAHARIEPTGRPSIGLAPSGVILVSSAAHGSHEARGSEAMQTSAEELASVSDLLTAKCAGDAPEDDYLGKGSPTSVVDGDGRSDSSVSGDQSVSDINHQHRYVGTESNTKAMQSKSQAFYCHNLQHGQNDMGFPDDFEMSKKAPPRIMST